MYLDLFRTITPVAHETIDRFNASLGDLAPRLTPIKLWQIVAEDLGYCGATIWVYGELPTFPSDWRVLARQLKAEKKDITFITDFCRLAYPDVRPTREDVSIALGNSDALEKKRARARAYWHRLRDARPEEYERQKARMRAYSRNRAERRSS